MGGTRDNQGAKKRGLCIGTASIIIARLGGALNRNSHEPLGPQTLLRGLRRFHDIGLGFIFCGGKPVDAVIINKLWGTRRVACVWWAITFLRLELAGRTPARAARARRMAGGS